MKVNFLRLFIVILMVFSVFSIAQAEMARVIEGSVNSREGEKDLRVPNRVIINIHQKTGNPETSLFFQRGRYMGSCNDISGQIPTLLVGKNVPVIATFTFGFGGVSKIQKVSAALGNTMIEVIDGADFGFCCLIDLQCQEPGRKILYFDLGHKNDVDITKISLLIPLATITRNKEGHVVVGMELNFVEAPDFPGGVSFADLSPQAQSSYFLGFYPNLAITQIPKLVDDEVAAIAQQKQAAMAPPVEPQRVENRQVTSNPAKVKLRVENYTGRQISIKIEVKGSGYEFVKATIEPGYWKSWDVPKDSNIRVSENNFISGWVRMDEESTIKIR